MSVMQYSKLITESKESLRDRLVVCITGERENTAFENTIKIVLDELKKQTELHEKHLKVIFGDCTGVDASAKKLCQEMGIDYEVYKAEWRTYGLAAGPLRNKQMIDIANVAYAFHSNIKESKGTKNTIKLAKSKGIPIHLFEK
jgi:hypothetical protein